ncbi:MAG TPA: 3'-5' exonuclease, partial [Thermoanaerobaculia bacterium]|nr:3'-5' exonuclease [Thermoanaerobaculia bacterium]
ASGALVAHNVHRRGKRLWTETGAGALVELYKATDEVEEARWIVDTLQAMRSRYQLGEMAILVRTNAQTRAIEEELLKREVFYTLVGGVRFYDRAEIKDLVAYLRVLRNPRDGFSLSRIFNQPPRGIGKSTLDLLQTQAVELGQPLWDVLYLDQLGGLPSRSAIALRKFRDLIVGLQRDAQDLPLPALLDRLLAATGYADLYRQDDAEDVARLENIREFLSAAQEFTEAQSVNSGEDDLLTGFLDHIALVNDLDSLRDDRGVSLMTLHSAKGLEFKAVMVAGLEDGLLPHFNSQGAREDVEEERRLLYVGMTRARERLFLTCCRRRRIAGRYQDQAESPFLAEIPPQLLSVSRSAGLFTERAVERPRPGSQDVYAFFGRERAAAAAQATFAPRERASPAPYPGRQERTVVRDVDDFPEMPRRPLKRGSRVRHPTLGQGVVLELDGQGEDAKITVFFERNGKRKLVARFANLELL